MSQLSSLGIHSWHDALQRAENIPFGLRDEVVAESSRCLEAMESEDIEYLVSAFATQDKWRILHHYLPRVSWFDIETTGLEYDDSITIIICWHKGKLHTFVEHENLDDFLDLLDDVDLLVSFNGSTFDVPRILDGFHIPELPCPHIDLRWPCYHAELNGGLKQITSHLGLERPQDLHDADGSLAVELWSRWIHQKDDSARRLLIRYCAADVLLMIPLTQRLARLPVDPVEDLWQHLPSPPETFKDSSPKESRRRELAAVFGHASPSRIRTRRRRV